MSKTPGHLTSRVREKDWGDWTDPRHPNYGLWLSRRQKYRRIIQRDHAALVAACTPRQAGGLRRASAACATLLSTLRWAFGIDESQGQ